ncbi:MAG: MMPL family transporter [Candidatus Kariarchaeaceae archaeon]
MSKIVQKTMEFYKKTDKLVVITWLAVAVILGGVYGLQFYEKTEDDFGAPEGTDGEIANSIFEEKFSQISSSNVFIFVLTSDDGESILRESVRNFTYNLNASIGPIVGWDDIGSYMGYYVVAGHPLFDSYKTNFVSVDNQTTFIAVDILTDASGELSGYSPELAVAAKDLVPEGVTVYLTGAEPAGYDTLEALEKDLTNIHLFTIPLIIGVLIYILREPKLLIIAVSTFAVSLGVTFGILDRLTLWFNLQIMSFIPTVIITIILAVGVDYNLFLLSRYREEREKGESNENAVTMMLTHAGHTITVSGLTLAVCFAGLTFFPMAMFSSMGISMTIAVLVNLIVNLSLTPSLLLAGNGWFSKIKNIKDDKVLNEKSIWVRIGRLSSNNAVKVIIVVFLLTLPVASLSLNNEPGGQFTSLSPMDSDARTGFEILSEDFSEGMLGPIDILLNSDQPNSIWSNETFDYGNLIVNLLLTELEVDPIGIQSIFYLSGNSIPLNYSMALISPLSPLFGTPMSLIYQNEISTLISDDSSATVIKVIINEDPYGANANEFIHDLREAIDGVSNETPLGYEIYVGGMSAENTDAIDETYSLFPLMILTVLIIVYIIVGLMFKSFFLPLRLIITIALTIGFIFGAAYLVFESTLFHGIFPALASNEHIFWMLPIMSFSIILGLGLDYDIFAIERIKSFVWMGYDEKEAVVRALDKTGRIITGAGLIMAIAFGGLMLSKSMVLIQFGFILALSVLIDTFVVRTILVPSILAISEKWNWWPSKPPVKKHD